MKKQRIRQMISVVIFFLMTWNISVTGLANNKSEEWEYYVLNDGKSVCITKYLGSDENVIIPEYLDGGIVTNIGEQAFKANSYIKKIDIPESVSTIGAYAFEGCSNLAEIRIPSNVISIGQRAFARCTSLVNVDIEKGVKSIGYEAFYSCDIKKIELPEGLITISDGMFWGCQSLEEVLIPDDVEKIGNHVFRECVKLKYIKLPEKLQELGSGVFNMCENLKSLYIPTNVNKIGTECEGFLNTNNLISIEVDKNNKVYDSRNKCNAIIETKSNTLIIGCKTTIIPDDVTKIGESAFCSCSGLEKIELPEGLKEIGAGAFQYCYNITNIKFPGSLLKIGSMAFESSGVIDVRIPANVQEIEMAAFGECTKLNSVVLENGVRKIGGAAFAGCKNLKEVKIPMSVNEIDSQVFAGCPNVVLQCYEGSVVHKYALSNNIPYEIINNTNDEDVKPEHAQCYIFVENAPLCVAQEEEIYPCVVLRAKTGEQVEKMYKSLKAESKDSSILTVDTSRQFELIYDDWGTEITKVICIKGLKPGTTDIEFSTSDGTSTTCTVTVEKNEQEVESDSYGKIEYAPTNIGNVYSATQQYTKMLDNFYSVTRNKMLTDRKEYNNQANYKELRAYDETAKERGTNKLLTFGEMVPDEAIDDAYEVLYEFLKECMKVGIEEDFIRINTSESTVKIEAKIINKIYDAIKKESNTFQGVGSNGYVVELTKTGIFGASFGTVTISGRKKSGMYSGAFCSSKNVVSATMNRFVDELSQEVKELYKKAAISLWNDFMRKSQLRDVTDEMFKSYLEDKTDYLLQRGYGKLLDTMLNNKRGYALVNDIVNAKTVKDAYNVIRSSDVKSLYNDLSKMKHTDKEIKDATIKNAMKNLEEARQKLQSALFDYLYNDNTYGSMDFGEKVNYKWKTVIQCPVNVEVYNARGRLIGYIRDGEVVYNNEIYLKLDGDVKTIYLPEDKEYYYKLIGTADGIMNCVVEKLDKGEPIARNNYYNVTLAKGIEYKQIIEKNSVIEGTQDIPLIKTDGKSVYADQYYEVNDKNANVAIVGDVVGRGNILGTGKYVIGDSVELDAVAENGYRFEGWYVNDTLVEIESIYRFTAKKNIKVTAKFNKIQQASTKYEVQLETYYKENANVLVYDNGTNAINIDLALYDTEDAQSYKLKLKQWDVQGNQYAGQKVDLLGDGGFHYILEKYSTQGWNSIDLLDSSDMVIATIKKIGENMDNDKEKTVDKEEPPNADAGEQKKNGNSEYNVQQEDVQTTIVTVPKVAKLKKVKIKATKKGFSLKWKRMKNISGYQVQYSIRKNFNVSKTKILKTKAVNYRAKKLKSKRKYYVRIRAYKEYVDETGKKMAYGKWKIVSTKTK